MTATTKENNGISLTTVFVAAATAIITGIPTDFISEIVIFPFFHNSTLGGEIINFSASILLPYYEAFGEWLGFPSVIGSGAANVPDVLF